MLSIGQRTEYPLRNAIAIRYAHTPKSRTFCRVILRISSYFHDIALLIDVDLANGAKRDIQAVPGVA
jgi:hypothetical protein